MSEVPSQLRPREWWVRKLNLHDVSRLIYVARSWLERERSLKARDYPVREDYVALLAEVEKVAREHFMYFVHSRGRERVSAELEKYWRERWVAQTRARFVRWLGLMCFAALYFYTFDEWLLMCLEFAV